ncbi:sodium-dependent glucose transporter 1B-like [Haemaphysalis longicornis]
MTLNRWQLFLRLGRTLNLNLGSFGMGLTMSLTGVALLDLVEIYDSSVGNVSHFITTRCVGLLLGSLLGGKMFDMFNTQLMAIATVLLATVTVLMIPMSGTLWLAHVMVFGGGMSIGAFDTGANVWIIKLWPENSSPALQVFHLAFALGCLVAPLIAEPFMSSTTSSHNPELIAEATGATHAALHSSLFNETHGYPLGFPNDTLESTQSATRIHYSFVIASAFHFLLFASMVALYWMDRSDFKPDVNERPGDGSLPSKETAEYVRFSRTLLALLCIYICVYVALEVTYAQMITSFAVKCALHFSKSSASRVAAVYFFCFAACRVVASLITVRVTSFQMMVAAHVVLALTAILLVGWGSTHDVVLWVGSALMGISQGPNYAAVVAWTVSYIHMSNKMMSLVIITAGIGSMSPSLLVGQFLDSCPDIFLYVCFATVFLSIVLFVVTYFYVRKRPMLNAAQGSPHLDTPTLEDCSLKPI